MRDIEVFWYNKDVHIVSSGLLWENKRETIQLLPFARQDLLENDSPS